jgi:hypothetical protein
MCGKLSSSSLHEKVAAWLGCIATRLLIDISAECLSKLIGTLPVLKYIVDLIPRINARYR